MQVTCIPVERKSLNLFVMQTLLKFVTKHFSTKLSKYPICRRNIIIIFFQYGFRMIIWHNCHFHLASCPNMLCKKCDPSNQFHLLLTLSSYQYFGDFSRPCQVQMIILATCVPQTWKRLGYSSHNHADRNYDKPPYHWWCTFVYMCHPLPKYERIIQKLSPWKE